MSEITRDDVDIYLMDLLSGLSEAGYEVDIRLHVEASHWMSLSERRIEGEVCLSRNNVEVASAFGPILAQLDLTKTVLDDIGTTRSFPDQLPRGMHVRMGL